MITGKGHNPLWTVPPPGYGYGQVRVLSICVCSGIGRGVAAGAVGCLEVDNGIVFCAGGGIIPDDMAGIRRTTISGHSASCGGMESFYGGARRVSNLNLAGTQTGHCAGGRDTEVYTNSAGRTDSFGPYAANVGAGGRRNIRI